MARGVHCHLYALDSPLGANVAGVDVVLGGPRMPLTSAIAAIAAAMMVMPVYSAVTSSALSATLRLPAPEDGLGSPDQLVNFESAVAEAIRERTGPYHVKAKIEGLHNLGRSGRRLQGTGVTINYVIEVCGLSCSG